MNWLYLLQQGSRGTTSLLDMLPMFAGIIFIMYFLVIRPNRRQEKQRQEMLASVQKNDKVLTTGGIYGVVTSVKDKEVVVKIDDAQNVKVRLALHAIANIIRPESDSSKSG